MSVIKNSITGRDKLVVTDNGVFDAITGRQVGIVENGVVKSITTGAAIATISNGSGGSVDLSFITAGAEDILSGKVGADAEGNPVNGTIPQKAAATFTPGTGDQTIAAGTYLSGKQTIKGDANLKAENIAEGIKIFGVTGTFAGGGGDLSFALITHYNPYAAAYEVVTSVGVSGFGKIGETDYSFVNGTFAVTDATAGESDPTKRVYKNGDYYLYWYTDMGDRMYGRWYIGKVVGSPYSDVLAYLDNFSEEVPSGTNYWYEQINWSSFQITTTPGTVTVPEVPERLTAVSATDYDPDTGAWTTGGATAINAFEKTPATDDVFAVKDGNLIGIAFSNKYPLAVPEEPTSHYDNGWVIGASSHLDVRTGYQAFVRYGQEWHSQSGHPQWLSWRNEKYKYCVKKYTLYNRPEGACQSLDWKIQGSDNGIDWTDLDHVVLESAEYGSVYHREIANNTQFFRMHRFYSLKANDSYTTVEYFTARGERMPDDISGTRYILTGAGEDQVNGEYIATGYNNDKGYPVYTNGVCFFAQVYENASQAWNKYWYVYKPYTSADPLNPGSSWTVYYSYYPTGGSSGNQFWNNSSGSDPLPTLKVVE
jgi:hypothetical protein